MLKHSFKKTLKLKVGGKYRTANGKRVEIFEIKDNGATCNCHGYLDRITPTGRIKKVWYTWTPEGSHKFLWGTSNLDLVEEILK